MTLTQILMLALVAAILAAVSGGKRIRADRSDVRDET